MRQMLLDLAPGQDYAVKFRSVGETDVSEWSRIYTFRTAGDTIPPAAPTGLVWRATGSSFMGTWNKVTVDGNGGELRDFKDYEVTVTSNSISKVFYVTQPIFELTLSANAEAFGSIAFTVQISVKSRDLTDNKSAAITATATEDTPPKPSTPVVSTTSLGLLKVTWDGNPATGVRNDLNLNHVEIHASTTTGFTPSTSTLVDRFDGMFPGTQSQVLSGLTYGTLYYIRLVAVNRFNRSGVPSDQASGTPSRITNLDITNGTIGTAQINFTAKDIGGANAYYPATTVARDALTGVKSGDIAFVTGANYTPYRYNGTTWVAAPEVGVIAGTKIITGTLTSDAVGTNLLITATANIANGIIDNAKISQLDAGKITTGTLQSSATVTYGSSAPRPTWSLALNGDAFLNNVSVRGQIVIGNSGDTTAMNTAAAVRSFDYIANTAGWAIKGDGSVEFNNGTFRGNVTGATITSGSISGTSITSATIDSGTIIGSIYKTASTGRRIEMGAAGAAGQIAFYAPDGSTGVIQGFTSTAGTEAIQMRMPIAGAVSSWNAVQVENSENVFLNARVVSAIIGGATTGTRAFSVEYVPQKTNLNTGRVPLFNVTPTATSLLTESTFITFNTAGGLIVYEHPVTGTDAPRLWIDGGGSTTIYYSQGATFNIAERLSTAALIYRMYMDDTDTYFQYVNAVGRIVLRKSSDTTTAKMQMVNEYNFGAVVRGFSNSNGTGNRVDITDAAESTYIPILASAFTVSSSEVHKTSIAAYNKDAESAIRGLTTKQFRRKSGRPDVGKREGPLTLREAEQQYEDREEVGFIAEEVPEEFRVEGGDLGPGVDMMGVLATNVHVTQRILDRLDAIEQELNNRNGKDKK